VEKKVLYIGNDLTYNLFTDIAVRTETQIVPFYAPSATADQIIEIALSDVYAMIILNVMEIETDNDELERIISSIQAATKSKLTIMAQGFSVRSNVILKSAQNGVSYFMLSKSLSDLNEDYKNALAGIKNNQQIIDAALKAPTKPENGIVPATERFSSISVAVAGPISRMGVTSVSIQLVKYFLSKGKTACYIDMSGTGYTELCKEYYDCDSEDIINHRITIDGIDMYYNVTADILQNIEVKNYNFMIFDVGNISQSAEKQSVFLQKKYRLLVVGDKPNEEMAFNRLMKEIYRTNITYLYNFVPQGDRESLIEDANNRNQKCYFVPFFDECFSLVADSAKMFDTVFSAEFPQKPNVPVAPVKKRRGLFRGRKEGGKK